MSKKTISLSLEVEEILQEVGELLTINWLEDKGFAVVSNEDKINYVNVEKSMGTEAFYELLEKAIEDGKLSLELLVGRIAVKNIMKSAKNDKPQ